MPEPASTTKKAVEGEAIDSPMEEQVQRLAQKVWDKYQSLDGSQRYLVAVAGIPGSGKTTFAASVAYALNQIYYKDRHERYPNSPDYSLDRARSHGDDAHQPHHWSDPNAPDVAHVLPMDGFHLTRAQLSAMPNPDDAHYRRGAAFTFDADAYLKMIWKLRQPIEATTSTIWAPSFDHEIKDPVEKDIPIPPSSRIIIVEGLYTALCPSAERAKNSADDGDTSRQMSPAWSQACELMDEIWLISVPIATATERVAKRNFKAGLSPSLEAALDRTVKNDMKNGQDILDNLPPADKLTEKIESVEDQGWKTREHEIELEHEARHQEEAEQQDELRRLKMERIGSIAEMVDAGAGM